MNIIQDNFFSPEYSWELLSGLPSDTTITHFPSERFVFVEGLVVKFTPIAGKPWVGNFHGVSKDYFSGVFDTPQANIVSVISEGMGYLINVYNPSEYSEIPILPIIDVYLLRDVKKIILLSFTDIAIYGSEGLLWILRVSNDGIKITDINLNEIRGYAWDSVFGKNVKFAISLENGNLSGGTSDR